jgi:hypothetical protein
MPDYSRDAYLHEGTVLVRGLARKGLARPIPPGECAIAALVCDPEGRIYGGTCGRRAHLFRYDPGPMGDCVMRIAPIGDEHAVTGLAAHGKHIFGATGRVAPPPPPRPADMPGMAAPPPTPEEVRGWLFRYDASRDSVGEYGYGRSPIEMLCQPLDGEPIAGIALDSARERIYGLGAATATFFSYDLSSAEVVTIGPATEAGVVSAPLIVTAAWVYGVVEHGRVFRYSPDTGGLDRLDLFIPSLAGLAHYNRLQSAAVDPVTGIVYGGTNDGLLFAMNPDQLSFVTLGKPVMQPGLRALTVAADGRVFGLGGDKGGMAHLFCYDPRTRDLRDLGILVATSERFWHGYEFGAAVTGRFGEIYFGEADRISHLFIYHPAAPPRAVAAD